MSILTTNNYEEEHLPEKIMQYIGMIVESEKKLPEGEDFFDYFCETSGNKILKLTLEVDPLLSVKILSMLFINLRSDLWVSYLLCQPFINDAIKFEDLPADEEWPEYYISLLKSLSIRLNSEQISLFFNKKFANFPLMYEAIKYYNHPDCMVRTNVMNIILGVMKIKDFRLNKYFGRFPFTSYVLTYCCQVKERIEKLNDKLINFSNKNTENKVERSELKSLVKMYCIDMIDYICYLGDLMELGNEELSFFVRNCILIYLVMPMLKHIYTETCELLLCSALYLFYILFKTINDDSFREVLCLLLTSRSLPDIILEKIKDSEVYIPKVYSEEFLPNEYYWNKYNYQIEKECMKLFEDVNNFETEFESEVENHEQSEKFYEEINKISECLGFDILNYKNYGEKVPLSELSLLLGFNKKKPSFLELNTLEQPQSSNPIRENLFLLLNKTSHTKDSSVLSITTLLNNFTHSEHISNKMLEFCGLLMPRLDTVHYKNEFNKNSLDEMRCVGIGFIEHLSVDDNKFVKEKEGKKRDEINFSSLSIKNMLILLNDCVYEKLSEVEEQCIVNFYRRSTECLKMLFTKQNMKTMVEIFEMSYSKASKEALVILSNLSSSVLIPRKSASEIESDESDDDSNTAYYFKNTKDKLKYFIDQFAYGQNLYGKYMEKYYGKNIEKYYVLYHEKYGKIEETLKVGNSYHIGFRYMVECSSNEKKSKSFKKLLIIEDKHNLIIVEPSTEENTAKITVNHPWKYVEAETDRETGKKMTIKLSQCIRGDAKIHVFFDNEIASMRTLEWMNSLKYERYQAEQAFILAYLKECLAKIQ